MKKNIIYITTSIIFILSLILVIKKNSNNITLIVDTAQSYYLDLYEGISSKSDTIKIINKTNYKRFKITYRNLPLNYIHTGDFLFYKPNNRVNLKDIASESIKYTNYYSSRKLMRAIRVYNAIKGKFVNSGQPILIPDPLPPFILDPAKLKKVKTIYTKGLYFTGYSVGNIRFLRKIKSLKRLGINTVVFDAKDVTGIVNYKSNVQGVKHYRTDKMSSIDNIEMMIRELKKNDIYVIARIAVFRDHLVARKNWKLAIKSKRTGRIWNAGSRELWCDPTNKKVQDYNINLAIELSEYAVDEIQFDYIRFPTKGNLKDAKYSYDFGKMSKIMTITNFLKRAYKEMSSRNTLLSIDIFGVVAWGKNIDIRKTGQKVELLSKYCDIISPMLYPSHFNDGFDGYGNPADRPYYFIYNGCKKVIKLLKRNIVVRPWLQSFTWRVTNYNEDYIIKQIKATNDSGAFGYLMWNASNNYNVVYRALERINKHQTNNK